MGGDVHKSVTYFMDSPLALKESLTCNTTMNPICAEGNLLQQSEPPADKRQRLLCTSAASAACCTTTGIPVDVALHESIAIACFPSVSDQNQLLPKPLCLGYLPDVPARTARSQLGNCSSQCVELPFFRPHGVYASRSKINRRGG